MTISTGERAAAFFATEMLGVHRLSLERNPLTHDGFLTFGADLFVGINHHNTLDVAVDTEHRHVLTVVLCLVFRANKLFTTCEAYEMLRMKVVRPRVDILRANDFFACTAAITKKLEIIGFTIRFIILDHEFTALERL